MISSTLRSKTRTISIDATPDAVLNVVADPYRLPSWAPNFARAVRPAGDDWLIQSVGAEALITVRVSRDQGTLDLLAARDHRRGAFSRVLPTVTAVNTSSRSSFLAERRRPLSRHRWP